MNLLDIAIILAIAAGAFLGFKSGFVWQIIRMLSWIIALWFAGRSYKVFSIWCRDITGLEIPPWLGYMIIFIILLLAFYIAGYIARTVVNALHVRFIDRIVGLILGALKVMLIISFLIIYIYYYADDAATAKNFIEGSYLGRCVIRVFRTIP